MQREAGRAHDKPEQQGNTRRDSSTLWDTQMQELGLSLKKKHFFSGVEHRGQGRGRGDGTAESEAAQSLEYVAWG